MRLRFAASAYEADYLGPHNWPGTRVVRLAHILDSRDWRSGVGKALMSVALEGLRAGGYRSAALWTLSTMAWIADRFRHIHSNASSCTRAARWSPASIR